MALFFIGRPVFAWVIALFIVLAGLLAIPKLPVAQYPSVAPPQIELTATYPGASAQTIDESVVSLIEQELNGVNHLLYFSSSSSQGTATMTITFQTGTNPELAKVDVQNRLKIVEPRLPRAVSQQGLQIEETSAGFLMIGTLTSTDGRLDEIALSDYLTRNVVNELKRLEGVGKAQLFGSERAMRIWIDPQKLVAYSLTPADVSQAIAEQNVQVSAGSIGDLPSPTDQELTATVMVRGQLSTPEEFSAIVLKANPNGSSVTVGDVARVEEGGQSYNFATRLDGKASVAVGVQLAPAGNAMSTATLVREKLDELSRYFPAGVKYDIPYDTSPFVKVSITKVIHTLMEAMALVFVVMFLFLQNIRYTLIPALVVPVALMGTFAVMYVLGFSINVLTLFGMVLAIGILVDDAIVVVENVERLMVQEGLSPKDATRKAMGEISSAIIGITLVLTAVFIPMAFMPGSVGVIYQQFSISMAVAIVFSAFLALSLTPALCATLLKPIPAGSHPEKRGFFGWFNRSFERFSGRYEGWVSKAVRRTGRCMFMFLLLVAFMGLLFSRLPSSFLPVEDQGYTITDIQLPPGASQSRTIDVARQIEAHNGQESGITNTVMILGFSFSGSGQNAALAFTTLKDWSQRSAEDSAQAIADRATAVFSGLKDAMVFSLLPPPVEGLGTSGGFEVRLQDRGGQGYEALTQARDELLGRVAASPVLQNVREASLAETPQVNIEVDRQQANAMGVSFSDIANVLSTSLGSAYVNDFPNKGRMQQVIVQSEGDRRQQVDDLLRLEVKNRQGRMVPVSAFAKAVWSRGPAQLNRYNGYPAVSLSGEPAAGHSTGEAMDELERLASALPKGFALEWTGLSLQERVSGGQASLLLALSMLVVFLCLAALYESWAIPVAVLLVVPLGILGAVLAVTLRGMPNDVFFKVGLITIIGLSAKNAILIIEFAKTLHDQGMGRVEASIQAARLRLRPIVMTSLAFILGVVPLVFATGASSASQQAIGTGVIGGMLTATLAVIFVPVFFVLVMGLVERSKRFGRTP
ncbi:MULTISPECIES: efflux RND transporter permease subunit [Pseudomonas syringae group]|uniref:Efflux pump membrane transporter n=2 Tax=Pseudomonas syringae group TaxID=136849 RepID=A0A0P9Y4M8_PSESI|nr:MULTISPECIES: efflux RND transporter permease subunit [Pseudomonas syringae group]EKN44556.1 hydrophobe/amphiphile efflux-1 protein [Pseudomonas viridiflava UASWS0038]KPL62072.1 acriflavine resistance protein B [Pseudomonas viridiflava]KPY43086.1 Hydrophobe/amphiphile efflux-1 protein [Pseudomonas syringae pv. ribicola]KPZ16491.1 Hydrophobe/amphiphile efflux-1 protein [Pseudomonas viridiflava]MCJ8177093.1 multidrug efflux RND transporter permease subunit [Pseudomonas viridiflava]